METSTTTTRILRFGIVTIAALIFSIGLAPGKRSSARAQSGEFSVDAAATPALTDQETQDAAIDAAQKAQVTGAQRAHDAADAAQQVLQSATQARDQLESDGAQQEQIDAADQAVAQAQADKESADEAAQKADEAAGEAQGQ